MKNKLKRSTLLALSLFLFFGISKNDVQAEANTNENNVITSEDTTRPYKIWVTAERSFSGYPPLTIQHQIRTYGAIYKGTLSLQTGFHGAGLAKYAGYVYNTNNNYRPLKIEQTK